MTSPSTSLPATARHMNTITLYNELTTLPHITRLAEQRMGQLNWSNLTLTDLLIFRSHNNTKIQHRQRCDRNAQNLHGWLIMPSDSQSFSRNTKNACFYYCTLMLPPKMAVDDSAEKVVTRRMEAPSTNSSIKA